jgi:hypothetical protein
MEIKRMKRRHGFKKIEERKRKETEAIRRGETQHGLATGKESKTELTSQLRM